MKVSKAEWESFNDMRADFNSVDYVGNQHYVFNIKDRKQYDAIMARIDELFFATDENTPKDDKRLLELDLLSAMVEEYEQEHFPIPTPSQKELASLLGMSAPRLCLHFKIE